MTLLALTETEGVVITGIIGGLFAGVVFLMKALFGEKRENQKQNHEQEQSDHKTKWESQSILINGLKEQQIRQDERIKRLEEDVRDCHDNRTRLMVDNEQLKGQLRLQEAAIRRLQNDTGTYPVGLSVPALITTDESGKVIECSQGVSAMFHWLASELVGQNVQVLIPEQYREKHQTALTDIVRHNQVPWPGQAIIGFGLTREGLEFPVTITLSGWRDEEGAWTFQAEVTYRRAPPGMEGSGEHRPLVPQGPMPKSGSYPKPPKSGKYPKFPIAGTGQGT